MPFKDGIEIVGCVGTLLRTDEAHLNDVAHDFFEGLSVLFIHSQQEKREHDDNHAKSRYTGSCAAFEQKEQRYTNEGTAAEADELSFCKIEHDLGFYGVQVFGDGDISQYIHLHQWALNRLLERLPVLNRVKQSSTA